MTSSFVDADEVVDEASSPPGGSYSKWELVASVCKESFYDFVQEFWDVIIAEEPVWNWHIKYLCDEMQIIAERVFAGKKKLYDIIVNIPPGTTKSTIISVMFPAWVWTRMPHARLICASHAFDLGMDLSRRCRDIITSSKYRKCFPKIKIREDQNTKGYFALSTGGMRYVATVGGRNPMGMHGHFLLTDDPIDPMQAISDADIKAANHWMDTTLPSRKIDKRIVPSVLVMQRLSQHDPSGHRLSKKNAGKIKHICLPAELSDKVSPVELAEMYKNGLLDPERLSKEILQNELATLGPFGYAGQFDQNPIPLGGGMFKADNIRLVDTPPTRWANIVRSWDKAGTGGKGAWTVGVLMGKDWNGRFWILDVQRFQVHSDEREQIIKDVAEMDGRHLHIVIEQEPGSGGKESAQDSARMLAGYLVRLDRPTGDKTLRAGPFSVQVNYGNVSMVVAGWNYEYLEELRHFPKSKYKDQVDASSQAFAFLNAPLLICGGLQ